MHILASSVSVFLALATLSCKTCEAMPQQLRPPTFSETCNYMGTVFPHGESVTPKGTCLRVTCYGGNMRVEGCPRQELDDPFCGYANGPGTDYPDCCPIQYCSTYRIQF